MGLGAVSLSLSSVFHKVPLELVHELSCAGCSVSYWDIAVHVGGSSLNCLQLL